MIRIIIYRQYVYAIILQFCTREKRYAPQVYSCNRSLIGLSYYAGCILLLKCNFIDCERSININFCFMRKIIFARVCASAFFFQAVCTAGSKYKHTYRIIHRKVYLCAFSKRTTHDIFALLYLDITIPVKILAVTYSLKATKLHLSELSNDINRHAESSTIMKHFLIRKIKI